MLSWEESKTIEEAYRRERTTTDGKKQAIVLRTIKKDEVMSGVVLEMENQGQKLSIEMTLAEYGSIKSFLTEFESRVFPKDGSNDVEEEIVEENSPAEVVAPEEEIPPP